VPDPTAAENVGADHGRGIWVMKSVMDQVSFEHGGTEVRIRKHGPPARNRVRGANEIVSVISTNSADRGGRCCRQPNEPIRQTKEIDVLKITRTETPVERNGFCKAAWSGCG